MMREVFAGCCMGLALLVAFVAGRASKDCTQALQVGRYYKLLPPTPEPAVNLISCSPATLHNSLETLRVCRARARMEVVK